MSGMRTQLARVSFLNWRWTVVVVQMILLGTTKHLMSLKFRGMPLTGSGLRRQQKNVLLPFTAWEGLGFMKLRGNILILQ